jgi:hypothetical protein
MSQEQGPEQAELDGLPNLLERSQQLKDEAARLLKEAAAIDKEISRVLEASLEVARQAHQRPQ